MADSGSLTPHLADGIVLSPGEDPTGNGQPCVRLAFVDATGASYEMGIAIYVHGGQKRRGVTFAADSRLSEFFDFDDRGRIVIVSG